MGPGLGKGGMGPMPSAFAGEFHIVSPCFSCEKTGGFCQMFFNDYNDCQMLPGPMGKGMGPPMGMGPEPCDVRLRGDLRNSAVGARNSVSRPRMGGKGMGGCGVELRTSWLSSLTCFMSPRSYKWWVAQVWARKTCPRAQEAWCLRIQESCVTIVTATVPILW